MSLVPRNSLFDTDRFFSDFWPATASESVGNAFFAPRVDITDSEDHYEITAELPGIDRNDIQVHVHDGILTLEAEIDREDREEKEGKVIRQERRYGKFMRSFDLGNEVHEADIKADFKDGILTLKAPKMLEPVPERRRISVN